jgi:uncharacterized protein YgbK (DUF1537 family)
VPQLRLIADDLTGALDAAAPFASAAAPIPVRWPPLEGGIPGSLAIDTETRDVSTAAAASALREAAPLLAGAELAFKKLDSRLRGHAALEIAACLADGPFRSALIAPAFPAQGRLTRGGRQLVRRGATLEDVGVDLVADLEALAIETALAGPGRPPTGPGVHLCDADSDADLVALVEIGKSLPGPVLWCGTAGLARALAGEPEPVALPLRRGPWLALIGTPHAATRAQASALAGARPAAATLLRDAGGLPAAHALDGDTLLHLDLPPGTSVATASATIDSLGLTLAGRPPPGLLVVSGGDTLIRLCHALGAEALLVVGELTPGIPLSHLEGGAWAGSPVVSKSGGFGAPGILLDIILRYERG